jgi:hypothetical protein
MTHDQFDPDDLDALRRLKPSAQAPSPDARPADGRGLRSPADGGPRNVQLNVRVRAEIKRKALEVARHRRWTMTEVIENAIEQLHAGAAKESRSPDSKEGRLS